VLTGQAIASLEIVIVGSSSGALGASNHVQWLVDTVGFTTSQISLVVDSFYMPISNIAPDSVSPESQLFSQFIISIGDCSNSLLQ
jgi:hypothetical protein